MLSGYLSSTIEEELQNILKNKSDKLKDVINNYITGCEASIKSFQFSDTNLTGIPFDAKRAFASGLTGLATFGGLALWAASLGNLGSYILVAKGVSILAALGIHVGGVGAAATAISAIGGPVVIAVALAVMAAIAIFSLLPGEWEKKLAKQLVKVYNEKDALSKYKSTITTFWRDTQVAFNSGADNMEKVWQEHIENLQNMINNYDINDIEDRISKSKSIEDFFTNIPL